jgi:hypothetical protein
MARDRLPNATLALFPGCSHTPFFEDPEQYLSMTGSEIAVWTSLADNQCPPARLLRPMVVTNEHFVKVGLPGYQLSENTAL